MMRLPLLGRASDEMWNEAGCPTNDPAVPAFLAGDLAHHADATVVKRPRWMELLAELSASRTHLGRAPEQVLAHAEDLRVPAKSSQAAADALAAPSERVALQQRARRLPVTVAHADLTTLK